MTNNTLIIIVIVVAALAFLWWYNSQRTNEPFTVTQANNMDTSMASVQEFNCSVDNTPDNESNENDSQDSDDCDNSDDVIENDKELIIDDSIIVYDDSSRECNNEIKKKLRIRNNAKSSYKHDNYAQGKRWVL